MTTHVTHAPELGILSKALQSLHHSLLEHQAYKSGFVGSPLDLFNRASQDSAFAWLKPLRDAIVSLDERRADATPFTDAETKAMHDTLRGVIDPEEGSFRDNLNAVFQSDPSSIWSLSSARTALDDVVTV